MMVVLLACRWHAEESIKQMEASTVRRAFDYPTKKSRSPSLVHTSFDEISLKCQCLTRQGLKRPRSLLRNQGMLPNFVVGRFEFRGTSPGLESWVVQL